MIDRVTENFRNFPVNVTASNSTRVGEEAVRGTLLHVYLMHYGTVRFNLGSDHYQSLYNIPTNIAAIFDRSSIIKLNLALSEFSCISSSRCPGP